MGKRVLGSGLRVDRRREWVVMGWERVGRSRARVGRDGAGEKSMGGLGRCKGGQEKGMGGHGTVKCEEE